MFVVEGLLFNFSQRSREINENKFYPFHFKNLGLLRSLSMGNDPYPVRMLIFSPNKEKTTDGRADYLRLMSYLYKNRFKTMI